MRTLKLTTAFLLCLFSFTAMAGSGHQHGHGHSHTPVEQPKAEAITTKIVSNLADQGVIEKSWKTIKISTIEQKVFSGNKEWVALFENAQVSDPKKRTLYIFLTLSGEYIAANYTGQ